jgi:hypothetical protein
MPLFGKTGAKARDFFSSPAGQQVMASVSQLIPGDPYGQFRANEARMAQREQLGTAFTDLLGQMRGPDTMTPQVNELIGGANMRGGQVGMAPMQMQTPRRAGLDYTDPATQDAFKRYMMAGGNAQTMQSIAESMQPEKRVTQKLGRGERLIDEAGNILAEGVPYAENPLVVPEGGTLFWPGEPGQPLTPSYKVPKTFAPPPPRAAPAPTTGQVPGPWNKYGVR